MLRAGSGAGAEDEGLGMCLGAQGTGRKGSKKAKLQQLLKQMQAAAARSVAGLVPTAEVKRLGARLGLMGFDLDEALEFANEAGYVLKRPGGYEVQV